MSPWWSEATATYLGAFGGAGIGILGGVYGGVAGVLASKGKARGAVLGTHVVLLGLGILSLLAGIVAAVMGQPYHVMFPLLLIGIVLTFVMGPLLPVMRRAYLQADQRRLEAEAIRRG